MANATKQRRASSADKAFERVHGRAESIKSDAESVIEVMDIGDEVRQGDIYITRIASIPTGAAIVKAPSAQLAPGTSQGSRHTIRSLAGVKVYRLGNPGPLDGPIIESENVIWVDHPEHGNRGLPAGCYAVTYQRAFAEELRAVQD